MQALRRFATGVACSAGVADATPGERLVHIVDKVFISVDLGLILKTDELRYFVEMCCRG
jgi:hypothetical protein